eukprot:Clim_evm84s156 gene=Clim_evmTU84s156
MDGDDWERAMVDLPAQEFGMLYHTMRGVFRVVIDIFFRDVEVTGLDNIPPSGPVIFVGNHNNQFVDGLMMFTQATRDLRFLVAQKSMDRPGIGRMAKAIGSIGVPRPQDFATRGIGTVSVMGSTLKGEGTRFKEDLGVKFQVKTERGTFTVKRVVSDTEATLEKDAPEEFTGLKYSIIPKLDQGALFENVWTTLHDGGCIGIFPEGGSHDRASLLPLKAGVTVMALGAMYKYPGLQVSIVPCGLNYLNPHKFRSTAFVEFGPPLRPDPSLVRKYATNRREACSELLEQITDVLKAVTVNAPDVDTRQVIRLTRQLFTPSGVRMAPERYLKMTRRFVEGYKVFKDDPMVEELLPKVRDYGESLKIYGLEDRQVRRLKLARYKAAELLGHRMMLVLFYIILGLPGLVIHLPVMVFIRWYSQQKAVQAVAESSVKIEGKDVLASWKLMTAVVLLPLTYTAWSVAFFFYLYSAQDFDFLHSLLAAAAFGVWLPFLHYFVIRIGEQGLMVLYSIKPLFLSMIPWRHKERMHLVDQRQTLRQEILTVVRKLGPQLFDDLTPDKLHRLTTESSQLQVEDLQQANVTIRQLEEENDKLLRRIRELEDELYASGIKFRSVQSMDSDGTI